MVFAALPECQTGEPPMNPIVTIQLPGRGLAQGETVEPADERGFVRDAYAQPDILIHYAPEKMKQVELFDET